MSDGKGTFQTICRNVSLALRYGFQVSVRVNIDKYNVDEVPRLLEWCFDAGWTNSNKFSLYFAPVTHHLCHSKTHQSQASELAKLFSYLGEAPGMNRVALRYWKGADLLINLVNHRYLELPRFHYCEAALGGQLVISPGGSLHACLESVGNDQLALGMWEPRFKIDHERSALWQRNVLEIPSCNSCQYRLFCGGGCSFARLSASNNNNEYCEKVDEQVEVALDYLWPHIVNLAIPSKT